MAKKKQEEVVTREVVLNSTTTVRDDNLADGCRDIKDLLAPAAIKVNSEKEMMVDDSYVRSFVLAGVQPKTAIGWLDALYNYNGDMDTAVYIEPVEDRVAIDELTKKISQYEADRIIENENGSVKNTTRNAAILRNLYQKRELLEQNHENMFLVEILCNMFQPTLKDLNKETQKLQSKLSGKKNRLMPLYLRQNEGFRSVLPFGVNYIADFYRNFGTASAADCFPFYNAEFSQEYGYMFALNKETGTPVFIDPFDNSTFRNANISIFGGSGAGKTYCVSLLINRFLVEGCYGVVVDADGEMRKACEAVKGNYLSIAPGEYSLNPFDIEAEHEINDDGEPTGKIFVNVKEKVSSLLNMISIMCNEEISANVRAKLADALLALYNKFGINEDPSSLYENSQGELDEESGDIRIGVVKKRMPQFSDFHKILQNMSEQDKDSELKKVVKALSIFCKDGLYDMFDGQTSKGVDIENAHLNVFDISKLEEGVLRPIAMYIVFSWIWDKFIKQHPERRKFCVLEEAWMMIKEELAGAKYTAEFTEKAARRIRKRNGSLIVSSQNVREFNNSPYGESVLDNTTIKILLGHEANDIATVQSVFQLSEGEKKFLLKAKKGDCLIKTKDASTKAYVFAFDFEDKLISKKYLMQNIHNHQ